MLPGTVVGGPVTLQFNIKVRGYFKERLHNQFSRDWNIPGPFENL